MASTPGRRRRDERGIATVVAVGLMGMLLSVTTIAVAGTLVAVTAHRAAAADLAALAGAQAIRDSRSACAAAASSARHNGGEVSDCSVAALDVSVTVQVTTPRVLGLVWSVPADARAGPGGVGGL